MTNLGSLPLELIPLIIKQVHQEDLYACTLISKLFYSTTSPFLWQALTISNKASLITINNTILTNPSLGHSIRHVDLGFPLTRADFLDFIKHTVRLETLMINLALIQTNDLSITRHFESHFPHLRTLHLKNGNMSAHFCHLLRHHCRQLDELYLLDCTGLSSRLVCAWMACSSLKCITVESGNMDLETNWPEPSSPPPPQQQQQHGLDRLSLIAPRISFLDTVLTMDNNCSNNVWSQLTCLHIATCHTIDESNLVAFFQCHRQLTSITFEGYSITDTSLQAMGMFLSARLEKVHLIGSGRITHHGVRRLVQCCWKMTGCQLDGCGILASRFPEAQQQVDCIFASSRLGAGFYLRYLDHRAIQTIQQQEQPKIETTMDG